jgi:hypothetical protein
MTNQERTVSVDELAAEDVEIVKVLMDDKGGVMYIGSLTGDEFVEWQTINESASPEEKKNSPAKLMVRSLVQGPDKHPDGTELSHEERVLAATRIGTDAMIFKLRKSKIAKTERLLKAIFKLNGISQKNEVQAKNE